MKKTILILGIIFLLFGVSFASSVTNNSSKLFNLNNPPYEPSDPHPEDGATNVPLIGCVNCTGGDPDGDYVLYDVYYGDTTPPSQVYWNMSLPLYCNSSWDFNTTYYWKVVSWDEHGASTEGPIWSFTTRDNNPPYEPSDPIPPDGAECVPLDITLCWTGGDPNPGDYVTFDVYFGVTNPPTIKSSNQTEPCYDPIGDLMFYKVYYWTVVAWDSGGLCTKGPIWSFTTGDPQPPKKPIIDGPKLGTADIEYEYSFVSTDPNNDSIRYHINWGDGISEVTDFHESSEVASTNHTWKNEGTYTIIVSPEDEYGLFGEDVELIVRMPRDKSVSISPLLRFLERYPLLNLFLQRLNIL